MGYDNTGILFYGTVLGDRELPWTDPDTEGGYVAAWEKYYLERVGFTNVVDAPQQNRQAAVLSTAGCVVGMYNSCHGPWHYIALAVAHHEGGCKPPLRMNPDTMLLLPPDADETIKRFCGYMGIPYQQPAWYLTGLYC